MLSVLKELGVIKRKRSNVFDPFEDKDKNKDLKQMRGKFMEDNSNNKITDWLIQKTLKKLKLIKKK